MTENVACVPTELFKSYGYFEGFSPDVVHYSKLLSAEVITFQPRDAVENDPDWKQLIPYVILGKHLPADAAQTAPLFFSYSRSRAQSEARLHNKYSIGIGGHVNQNDDAKDPFTAGMWRELGEEITLLPMRRLDEDESAPVCTARIDCMGFINDDSNAVGKVHLGVVFLGHASRFVVLKKENSMHDAHWYTASELKQREAQFETWSRICINEFLLKEKLVLV